MRKLAPPKVRLSLRRETLKVLPRSQLAVVVGGETADPQRCLSLLVAVGSEDSPTACTV